MGIIAFFGEEALGGTIELKIKILLSEAFFELLELNIDNRFQLLVCEAVENNDVIDAIKKFGAEEAAQLGFDTGFHLRLLFKREFAGILFLALYFGALPGVLAKTVMRRLYAQLDFMRYSVTVLLFLTMFTLPLKMARGSLSGGARKSSPFLTSGSDRTCAREGNDPENVGPRMATRL